MPSWDITEEFAPGKQGDKPKGEEEWELGDQVFIMKGRERKSPKQWWMKSQDAAAAAGLEDNQLTLEPVREGSREDFKEMG